MINLGRSLLNVADRASWVLLANVYNFTYTPCLLFAGGEQPVVGPPQHRRESGLAWLAQNPHLGVVNVLVESHISRSITD